MISIELNPYSWHMELLMLNWNTWNHLTLNRTISVWSIAWKFGLVSLFNGISTLFRLFNAKTILLEEQ